MGRGDEPAAAAVAVEGVGTGDVAVEEQFGGYEAGGGVGGRRLGCAGGGAAGEGRGGVGGKGDEDVEAVVEVVVEAFGG